MGKIAIELPLDGIKDFCKKWKVREFSLFGSVLRNDFNPKKSDIDVLVDFLPDANWGWHIVNMKEELEELFKRPVDIVTRRSIEKGSNEYKKQLILGSAEIVYEQAA